MPNKLARLADDLREVPSYTIREAAFYLDIPFATLRSWVLGRTYPRIEGQGVFKPVITIPQSAPRLLSFTNLVEAHVLDAIRRKHRVPLPAVRKAIEYLQSKFPSRHPLADQSFETDGADLFVEKFKQVINISRDGQLAMRELLQSHLRRIDRDTNGLPLKLYPFTRRHQPDDPKVVVIDPRISFGRPVLAGTGIATAVIAERLKAGETIDQLAEDYGRQAHEIEEAIRYELQFRTAA